jgi:hypothetical protein
LAKRKLEELWTDSVENGNWALLEELFVIQVSYHAIIIRAYDLKLLRDIMGDGSTLKAGLTHSRV